MHGKSRGSLALLAQSKGNVRLALLLRSHAEEDRFRLTSSFRKGPLDLSAQDEIASAQRNATPKQFRTNHNNGPSACGKSWLARRNNQTPGRAQARPQR